MRIIAGTHRGRKLLGPDDQATTRPITDRVKQAMFDRLQSSGRLDGAVVADLFAGTGSMGLECVSRGAEHVTFVERDRTALDRLRGNIAAIAPEASTRVIGGNALGAALAETLPRADYSLVFLDPPYAMLEDEAQAGRVQSQAERLASACREGALLLLRAPRAVTPGPFAGWRGPQAWPYGSMTVHAYHLER